jgi:hypothetical protein
MHGIMGIIAMGVGKDSYMFQNFGVFPFDRLNDTERIIVLTEVAEAMSGYKTDLKCNILNESALYAVFALMKARIKKELDDGDAAAAAAQQAHAQQQQMMLQQQQQAVQSDGQEASANGDAASPQAVATTTTGNSNSLVMASSMAGMMIEDESDASFLWRRRVLEAYEQVYNTNASLAGLSIECWKRSVWNTVVNLLARSLFGSSFWEKKRMFLSPNALERVLLLKNFQVPPSYFVCKYDTYIHTYIHTPIISMCMHLLGCNMKMMRNRLPSTASIEIQLTFKKLITMSKTFLCDEPVRPNGCFCQDCIAELEVLTYLIYPSFAPFLASIPLFERCPVIGSINI